MVPKGWEVLHLKDVASKIQDGNYGADYPKADEFVASGIPFLTSKVIGGIGTINPDKFDYIKEEKHQSLKKAQIVAGDILFTNRGANVGTIAIVPDYIATANIGPQLTLVRCNDCILKEYLFQFLRGSFFQKQIQQRDSGSAMNFFGIKDTERFKVLVPSLSEQKRIAQILSTWDKAISVTEKLLANSQQQKKALMQQLLTGKKRLLDENGVRFNGKWEKKLLSDVADVYQPKTISQSMMSDSGYPVYGANGVIGFYQEFNHETEQIAVT
ncbi:restriction endonuclease subunit S [Klebsiella sp. K6-243]|nr:restriction endonuclease subunit S [Klebsiella sp. K6-243]MDK1826386.1 restriction endonuclease subunit S [Klebsiella sp. K6-243]